MLPPDAVSETLPQPVVLPLNDTEGKGLTVTVTLVVTWHPPASVPVTEKVVVAAGETVTEAFVPKLFDHE